MTLPDQAPGEQIQLLHPPTYPTGGRRTGRIALSQRLPESRWLEHLYRHVDFLAQVEDLLRARDLTKDLYFSLNAFGKFRRLEHLVELRSLFVDLDCYRQGISPDYAKMLISELVLEGKIPQPNILAYSGRGLWSLWLTEPAPKTALPLWSALIDHFITQTRPLGADPKSRDAPRIIRLPGSRHPGAGADVVWEVLHEHRYRLDWLRDEFLPTLPAPTPKQPGRRVFIHRKFMSLFSLHMTIIEDLKRLAEIRGRSLRGHRAFFLFIWRNCLVRLGHSKEESEREIRGVALEYLGDDALPDREWVKQTLSAHRAKHKKKDGDEENGYTLSAAWIMDRLAITEAEQRQMKVLIGRAEKYRRKNEKRRPGRYKKTRAEYLAEFEQKRELVRSLLAENPNASQQEIARLSGVSQQTVSNVLKRG